MLAFLAMRFPLREGDHRMHFGNIKNADQLVDNLEAIAVSRSLPHVEAKAERWLFGTRFIKGVSSLQMSIKGTEKDEAFASRPEPASFLSIATGIDGDFPSTPEAAWTLLTIGAAGTGSLGEGTRLFFMGATGAETSKTRSIKTAPTSRTNATLRTASGDVVTGHCDFLTGIR